MMITYTEEDLCARATLWSNAGQSQPIQIPRFILITTSLYRNAHKVEFDPHVKMLFRAAW